MYGTQNYGEFNYNDPTILVVLSSDSLVLSESTTLVLAALDSLGISEANNLTVLIVDTFSSSDSTATLLATIDDLALTEVYDIVVAGSISIVDSDNYTASDTGTLQTEIVFCSISKSANIAIDQFDTGSIAIDQIRVCSIGTTKEFVTNVKIGL